MRGRVTRVVIKLAQGPRPGNQSALGQIIDLAGDVPDDLLLGIDQLTQKLISDRLQLVPTRLPVELISECRANPFRPG